VRDQPGDRVEQGTVVAGISRELGRRVGRADLERPVHAGRHAVAQGDEGDGAEADPGGAAPSHETGGAVESAPDRYAPSSTESAPGMRLRSNSWRRGGGAGAGVTRRPHGALG